MLKWVGIVFAGWIVGFALTIMAAHANIQKFKANRAIWKHQFLKARVQVK